MYKEHDVFNPPSCDATLWRYCSFAKFMSLLEKEALFFARADKLGDLFEGTLTKKNLDTFSGRYKKAIDKLPNLRNEYLNVIRQTPRFTLISCWHENAHESDAMWKLYCGEQECIAIKTNFESFKQSFIDEEDVFVGKVNYIDYQDNFIPENNLFYPYLHKRKNFEHEKEVRAIMTCFPTPTGGGVDLSQNTVDVGKYCKVNISSLVQGIVVTPYAEDWFSEMVVSICKKYGLNVPIYKSALRDGPPYK